MKKENKLVIKLLDWLAAKHSHMSFLYGFDVWANQHVIEVRSREGFQSEEYMNDRLDAIVEFISKFPYQGILFLSNDPYLKVEDPIYNTADKVRKVKPTRRSASPATFQQDSMKGLAK
ncbi:hypothetical protein [Dyadobacter arcticus]|uniref:Uncharacterized protein n=1 Tax=Dyadobacter arcticus TaxID=1078754 RepID=A0ABX0UIX3_9BACT|nr:hypothetical protein [Dyadobacter arcticus]NIJ52857.1 hypothetical protein [Dyadobacter arcticus]